MVVLKNNQPTNNPLGLSRIWHPAAQKPPKVGKTVSWDVFYHQRDATHEVGIAKQVSKPSLAWKEFR